MKKEHFDYILVVVVVLLIILGILILSSVSAVFSQEKFGRPTDYLFHQIIYGLIPGVILGLITFKVNLSFFKKWSWLLILINLVLMTLVFLPKLGLVSGGAYRWLNLGFISFQPSEFLKLTFIIYLSVLLTERKGKFKITLLPFLVVIGVIILLLAKQSDISTLGIIIFIAIFIYFSASTPLWHSIFVFLITSGALIALIKLAPYRMMRLLVLLGLVKDPMGLGYQIKQALITIGSGGIFGLGLGMSNQKFGSFLPQTMGDSIFAIFAEETGFIGATILVLLFLAFLWRGFKIAKLSQDRFSKLFAIGISFWICLQAFINISSMIGIFPLSGIPLPFISYGGSHLAAELIGIGILLNISKTNKKMI